jgi:hypothetical protein
MEDWLHNLPFWWMALVVFVIVFSASAGIFWVVGILGRGSWALAFKSVSVGLLSPLGVLFGLLVVFILA